MHFLVVLEIRPIRHANPDFGPRDGSVVHSRSHCARSQISTYPIVRSVIREAMAACGDCITRSRLASGSAGGTWRGICKLKYFRLSG